MFFCVFCIKQTKHTKTKETKENKTKEKETHRTMDCRWQDLLAVLHCKDVSLLAYNYLNQNIHAYVVQYKGDVSFVYRDLKSLMRHLKLEDLVLFEHKFIRLHRFAYTEQELEKRKEIETDHGMTVFRCEDDPLLFAVDQFYQMMRINTSLHLDRTQIAAGFVEPVTDTHDTKPSILYNPIFSEHSVYRVCLRLRRFNWFEMMTEGSPIDRGGFHHTILLLQRIQSDKMIRYRHVSFVFVPFERSQHDKKRKQNERKR